MSGKIVVVVLLCLGLTAGGVLWCYRKAHPVPRAAAAPLGQSGQADNPEDDAILRRIVNSGPMARPRDAFRVIERPEYLSVEQAADSMSDEEVVLGLELAGDCRAYPINYINDHEMVREQIGESPLLITW